jgi:hypothetical protein
MSATDSMASDSGAAILAADHFREAFELRVLTTLLGPHSSLGWDLAKQAADSEVLGWALEEEPPL